MSRVTIVSTATYAYEIEVPLGFLADEVELGESITADIREAFLAGVPLGANLRDLQVTTTVVAERPW
ncbi:hypothetical protein [Streptodolium elevatio]|uniref:Uncharacterized protein n=1 Tax=Streptodolium elevatio TaxID=3157996 RepID=A0ABV3DBT9_9ACTN